MPLLQVKIDDKLSSAIKSKAKDYSVTASSLVKIVLAKSFLQNAKEAPGNVFNSERDNNGKGINVDELIDTL